jgi:hypothetical protein
MTNPRAIKYRRLALREKDPEVVRLLQSIADEAENGTLCAPPRKSSRPIAPTPATSSDAE